MFFFGVNQIWVFLKCLFFVISWAGIKKKNPRNFFFSLKIKTVGRKFVNVYFLSNEIYEI